MLSALFVYDNKGDILVSKIYKNGVKRNISDVFRIQVITSSNQASKSGTNVSTNYNKSPVLTLGSTSFIYIRSGKVWLCAITRSNQDCSVVFEFLYKLESLLKLILLGTNNINNGSNSNSNLYQLNEELLSNNFVMINEILDEIVEFGYPTDMELNHLKQTVLSLKPSTTSDSFNLKLPSLTRRKSSALSIPVSLNSHETNGKSKVSWRDEGIKYRRNEIFLNVEEKINILMNSEGQVLRSYIDGVINMKTHLSGMPECKFGFGENSILLNSSNENSSNLNENNVILEDSKFHQCVDLSRFDFDRSILFIPPDGEFQLMNYHCRSNINLPFQIYPQITEIGNSKLSYKIRVKSLYSSKLPALDLQVKIPTPTGVLKSNISNSSGKSKYHPDQNLIIWKFNKFFGEQEHILTAEVDLTQTTTSGNALSNSFNWTRPPLTLDFKIDMFSCSGLTVKFLKVQERGNYKTVKWVKYCTHSGSYEVRL
ncbi:Mu homology domain-containing protein [Scheffersomyces amazonensis]|uniref:Mu homology domain-containing protein n=1 Tax=Scheffersomyces amazonensis TaxID=1078765 RepID=UPI00315D7B8E